MTALRLGSLFDGIGVFPLAAVRCGIEPIWASEIEKAPISITKRHFPDMAHLGDVTKLDGREIPPVHIITFGSPCQNLSQIGNRKGLAGEKSNLFFQAIRIILLRDPLTASYFVAVWKMLRKKGCVPSALTQTVKDLLASREIENILDNTDFMVLLSQAQSDRAILAKQLGISEHQLSYITHSNSGEGLLFYGNVTIPFVDRFPRGEIYDLLTTRPEDLAHERTDE